MTKAPWRKVTKAFPLPAGIKTCELMIELSCCHSTIRRMRFEGTLYGGKRLIMPVRCRCAECGIKETLDRCQKMKTPRSGV